MVVAVALLLWPIATTSATIEFVTAGSSPVRLFYLVCLTVGLFAVVAALLKWSTGSSWSKILLPLSLRGRVETRRVSEESRSTDRTSPGEQAWKPTRSCKGRSNELLQWREKLQVVGLKTESGLSSARRGYRTLGQSFSTWSAASVHCLDHYSGKPAAAAIVHGWLSKVEADFYLSTALR
jgi:hypothetical protein